MGPERLDRARTDDKKKGGQAAGQAKDLQGQVGGVGSGDAHQVVRRTAGGAVERWIGGRIGVEGGGKGGAGREKGEPGRLPGPAAEKIDGATRQNRAGARKRLGTRHLTVLCQESLDIVNDPAGARAGGGSGV